MRKNNSFKITVVRDDEIDGFAAYAADSVKNNEDGGLILLNIEGCFNTKDENGVDQEIGDEAKNIIIDTLMFEVGVALEEWFDVEFDEDRLDRIIESFNQADHSNVPDVI